MKHFIRLILLACALSAPAHAQTKYISDDLFTYMHSGPGTQYRILGSVNAGAKVTQLEASSGYIKIKDSRGREGWIKNDFITNTPGLKERLPALEKELTETKAKLATAEQDADQRNASLVSSLKDREDKISDLEERNQMLSERLNAAETEVGTLSKKLDTQHNDLLMRWFMRGGMVAGGGLLLGLLLPHLIPRKKKSPSGWA
ncbi:TIGR04211 family SH3 domain-containing protein [Thaumasiovibrio subtropicus]|uniref:TIGR04211 family SH3 domain-containing protein n=1 Tax=Thaumasiovibrio subtropicus TaxID=1891207 RepID=UPI000B356678|nr:TIGR04211 family SH3 domain-containing protein [Thaumasiovibrio subtropicus]